MQYLYVGMKTKSSTTSCDIWDLLNVLSREHELDLLPRDIKWIRPLKAVGSGGDRRYEIDTETDLLEEQQKESSWKWIWLDWGEKEKIIAVTKVQDNKTKVQDMSLKAGAYDIVVEIVDENAR